MNVDTALRALVEIALAGCARSVVGDDVIDVELPTFVGEVVGRRWISADVDAANTTPRESRRRRRPTAQR